MSQSDGTGLRIGLYGTCQVRGIRRGLQALLPKAEIRSWHFGVSPVGAEAIAHEIGGFDLVVSQLWEAEAPLPLKIAEIRKSVGKAWFMPPVVFRGFHPDQHYIQTPEGGFLVGPLGHYHSLIIAASYALEIPVERVATLFNMLVFQRLGYFESHSISSDFMVKMSSQFEFDLNPLLPSWNAAPGGFMHTINHPKSIVLASLATLIGARADYVPQGTASPIIEDDLLKNIRWPVYPEIARRLGFAGSRDFIDGRRGPEEIPLKSIVENYYRIYATLAPGVLKAALPLNIIENIREIVGG